MASTNVDHPDHDDARAPSGQESEILGPIARHEQSVLAGMRDFDDPGQEWRRLFSEVLGTFMLVRVAAGGGMMSQAFPDTISRQATGASVWNTALLIGWDEPGGTYDHVPPGPVAPPDASAPPGERGFTFDRSGYRVPAVIVSPWVAPRSVYNEEYRHTSLIATLQQTWGLGDAFTQRDASARTFGHVFSRTTPRDPTTWATVTAHPVPAWTMDLEVVGQSPEHPRQGHGTQPPRQGQRDGREAPAGARRPRRSTDTRAHRPLPAGHRRPLLPTPGPAGLLTAAALRQAWSRRAGFDSTTCRVSSSHSTNSCSGDRNVVLRENGISCGSTSRACGSLAVSSRSTT
jgi:hypothetical protein